MVRYTTQPGTGIANTHYTPASGMLNWGPGDTSTKTVVITTPQNTATEGDRVFSVAFSDASGAVLSTTSARITVTDDEAGVFPQACQLPTAGWSRPASATTYWEVAQDSASEGRCSLKSISPGDSPANEFSSRAQIQYSGNFAAGNISFDQRVSSEAGWDCLRFYIDGIRQNIGSSCAGAGGAGISGDVSWTRVTVPITAGAHTVMWSYEKDDSVAIGRDAAWIDNLSMPTQAPAVLSVLREGDGSGTVSSAGGGAINCGPSGGACSTTLAADSTVTLIASPLPGSVFAGWRNDGSLVTCVGLDGCAVRTAQGVTVTATFASKAVGAKDSPVLSLASSANPASASAAASFTLSATVSAAVGSSAPRPSGSVSFSRATSDGAVVICRSVPLGSSATPTATCPVPPGQRGAGVQQFVAVYEGDAAFAGAATTLRQVFGDSAQATALVLTTAPAKPLAGETVTIIASVSGPTAPMGSVLLTGLTGCGTASLVSLPGASSGINTAVATCRLASIAAGQYTINANYLGTPGASGSASSASLSFTVGPTGPLDYTDMWWAGSVENGWGMSITQKGGVQFNALYVYDEQGRPVWYVMPGGSWDTGFTTFTGTLYQPRSAPFFA
jgi:hypothetical protein